MQSVKQHTISIYSLYSSNYGVQGHFFLSYLHSDSGSFGWAVDAVQNEKYIGGASILGSRYIR